MSVRRCQRPEESCRRCRSLGPLSAVRPRAGEILETRAGRYFWSSNPASYQTAFPGAFGCRWEERRGPGGRRTWAGGGPEGGRRGPDPANEPGAWARQMDPTGQLGRVIGRGGAQREAGGGVEPPVGAAGWSRRVEPQGGADVIGCAASGRWWSAAWEIGEVGRSPRLRSWRQIPGRSVRPGGRQLSLATVSSASRPSAQSRDRRPSPATVGPAPRPSAQPGRLQPRAVAGAARSTDSREVGRALSQSAMPPMK